MATCFDENSVDLFEKLDLDIMKVASSDINDATLEKLYRLGNQLLFLQGGLH